jgi:hypothetical protein
MKPSSRTVLLAIGLITMLFVSASLDTRAQGDTTNQFLFLTLRLKNGTVTLEKAQTVAGTLKPQLNSTDERPLLITLEQTKDIAQWSLAIEDPSVQRLEYEDPEHPGMLKSKLVVIEDIEFIVRTPLITGVRHLAVHRKTTQITQAVGNSSVTNSLLARIELPQAVTK